MFGFTKSMTVVSDLPKKLKVLSTEICGYDIARSEQYYKPEVDLHYNRTKGVADAVGQMRTGHSQTVLNILYLVSLVRQIYNCNSADGRKISSSQSEFHDHE